MSDRTDRVTVDPGWEQHLRDRQRAWLETTPAERLRWLEEAIRFARRAGALTDPDEGPALD